jgi:MFS family permease
LGLGKIISIATGAFGVGLMAFAFSRSPVLSMILIFITGMGMMVQLAAGNTILQTIVEEDKRGRVMSLYTMSVAGMVPFGSLFAGIVAKHVGAPVTLFIGGATCTLGAIVFTAALPSIREQVRPIYRGLGILPRIAEGLQQSNQFSGPPEA